MDISNTIQEIINSHDIVLFMKGNADFPQCGFSAKVVSILRKVGVEFHDINVLTNEEMRSGIKVFSNWPTIPQLYIRQEFIGGCDIVSEMMKDGELERILLNNE